jgi:hypothetical protein
MPTQCCLSRDSSWLPYVITRCNKQSWLCQDRMCPSYEGLFHLSRSRRIGRRTSTPSLYNGLVFSSLEPAWSANGVDFVHSQSAASYEATLEALAVTASGVTMVLAAMQLTWETRPLTTPRTTLRTATLRVIMKVISRFPPRNLRPYLGDRLGLSVTRWQFRGTYEAFLLFV